MLAALSFLGTWPAVMTLLERRGRLPQHTYLDYSLTNLLAAVLIALTLGQIGDGKPNMPNFFTQLTQDNWPSVLFAMAGGIVLSLGNLATQYAWAYVGLSVTEVISSSMTVVIGTTLNYFLDDRINRAEILFPGVGCFLIAVCLGSAVHSSNAADNEKKLSQIGDGKPNMPNFFTQLTQDNWPSVLFAMAGGIVLSLGNLATQYAWAYVGLSVTEVISSSMTVVIGTTLNYFLDDRINRAEILFPGVGCFLIAVCLGSAVHSSNAADNEKKLSDSSNKNQNKTGTTGDKEFMSKDVSNKAGVPQDLEDGVSYVSYANFNGEKAKAGTAEFLIQLENKRSIKVIGSSTCLGLSIVFFAGVCFSLFSPAFNLATNDQWHTLKEGVPHLVVYTAFFYFSISCFVIGIDIGLFWQGYSVGLEMAFNSWVGKQLDMLQLMLFRFL
ncbi:hypothetical protein COCNU_05G001880 [Cocos nucifera]|uniref:Ureide permease n=1 Tax=Cocos nucifera TaxID=13894 RepID=A0A8K0I890_COCNU|nr:hypothetical protein COCNU_05G001880 [Cocos nucifera]